MAKTVDDQLDALYGLPLGEFVSARNELARSLKKEGHADEAAEVGALEKPTVPVWLANQLARRHRRDVDLLLDAGHRLREAQRQRDPEETKQAFERARTAERKAMEPLLAAAAEILREEQGKAGQAMLDRTAATLRAAAVTEDARELLARGRLTHELATTGFDLAASLSPAEAAPRKRSPSAPKKAEQVAEARAALDEAKEREREAKRAARDAERAAAEARRSLAEAEESLERARDEAAAAAEDVEAAADALKRAKG